MTTYPPPARTVLRLNAVLSIAGAVMLLLAARPLASALGLANAETVAWLGIGVLVVGLGALTVSLRRGIKRPSLVAFGLLDVVCVIASLAALVFAPHGMTIVGRALLAAITAIVAWFAMAELRAARRL